MTIKKILVTFLALPIIGCASPLRVETSQSGMPVSTGSRYVWLVPDDEQPHLPESSRARIASLLAEKGLVAVAAGEKADYLLLVDYARRPAKVGLAALDPPVSAGAEPDWLAKPGKRGKQLSSLQLHFLNSATGQESGLIAAQARHGKRDGPIVLDRLIDGALQTQTP